MALAQRNQPMGNMGVLQLWPFRPRLLSWMLAGYVLWPAFLMASPPRPGLAILSHSTNAGAALLLRGVVGHSVRVDASENFVDWSVVQTGLLDGTGTGAIQDLQAKSFPARFYRAVDLDAGSLVSSNVVGFATTRAPAGRTLIANPFLTSNATIDFLVQGPPHGVSLYKVLANGEPVVNNYLFGWSDPVMTLLPGEGALLHNPTETAFAITFMGEVLQGPCTNYLQGAAGGYVLASSMVARAGALEGELNLPLDQFICVEQLDHEQYLLDCYDPDGSGWDSGESPRSALGEAFLFSEVTTAWAQELTITTPRIPAYVITNYALATLVPKINFTTFNPSNAFGRVFDTDGITPLGANFLAQVYAGMTNDAASLGPVGIPVGFLDGAGAGYVRSGLVPLNGVPGDQLLHLQLRVWEAAGGASYEAAKIGGSKAGTSIVFGATPRRDFAQPPAAANNFPSFSLSGSQIIAIRVNGQTFAANEAAVPAPALVSIDTAVPGGQIFYTLDGSPPSQGSLYLGAFPLTHSAVIQAVVYTADLNQSVDAVPFMLKIIEAPKIVRDPRSLVLAEGSTAEFSVEARGSAPLGYQWFRNAQPLPGAHSALLQLSSVQTIDAGDYSVVVSNVLGVLTSAAATLFVGVPPGVSVSPLVTNAFLGSNITFWAEATGEPPPCFQWRKNGVNIPGATNDSLTVTNVRPADGGSYSVVVANALDTAASVAALLLVNVTSQAPPADHFTNRLSLSGASGYARGTNLLATREPGEPRHAGKFGSNSVWYTWQAPDHGIATFRTAGSTFDTLLAVYTGTNLDRLETVARDEDRAGFLTSEVRFNTIGNESYQIAIDGYVGEQGVFLLGWELEFTSQQLPVITTPLFSQTVAPGSDLTLTIGATGTDLRYQWYFNTSAIPGATSSSLDLAAVDREDAGYYSVAITNDSGLGRGLVTVPVALELGTQPGLLVAQDKFEDWIFGTTEGSGFRPASAGGAAFTVGVGTIGSHLFSNVQGTTSTNEPNACGQIANATMWLFLHATNNGSLRIDTRGSGIPTMVSVYLSSVIGGLRSQLACAVTNAPDGSCVVTINAEAGAYYRAAVDGLNGMTGQIQVNWAIGQAPVALALIPNYYLVKRGSRLVLQGGVSAGDSPTKYQWWFNSGPISGATNTVLLLTNIQPAQAGLYSIHASNALGQLLHAVATLEIDPALVQLVASTFDSNRDGWSTVGDVTNLLFQSSGGNPGGFIQAFDRNIGDIWHWVAPTNYSGNWSHSYGGWLQFDLKQSVTTLQNIEQADVILHGAGTNLVFNTITNPSTSWVSYKIPLRENGGWKLATLSGPPPTREQMLSVLSDVTGLQIRGEFSSAADIGSLDNVGLIGLDLNTSPVLLLRRTGSQQAILEWPANALGFRLVHTGDLDQPWTNAPLGNVIVSQGLKLMPVPTTNGSRFFQLRNP
jgi:hypothetical protein